jgi:hypothetical protein
LPQISLRQFGTDQLSSAIDQDVVAMGQENPAQVPARSACGPAPSIVRALISGFDPLRLDDEWKQFDRFVISIQTLSIDYRPSYIAHQGISFHDGLVGI